MTEKIIKILQRNLQLDMPNPEEAEMKAASEIELIIEVEVDKRIKERMPSLDDLGQRLDEFLVNILDEVDFYEWLRSRLTKGKTM